MKIETFFQDLAWTENIFTQDERRQEIFCMLKPFVNNEDLELAAAMGDPTLVIPIWIGRLRQNLKKKRKEKFKKTLRRIISSQKAPLPVSTQPEPSFSSQNNRVIKVDTTHNDAIAPNQSSMTPSPDLVLITPADDPDVIMEEAPGNSWTPPHASKKKSKQKRNAPDHVPSQDGVNDQMDDIIYASADPSPESSPDINISPPPIPITPVIPNTETHSLISDFDSMILDDLDETATQNSATKLPLKDFEKFNEPKNSFIPDTKQLVLDAEAVGRTAHFSAEGFFYTTKQVRKPSAFSKISNYKNIVTIRLCTRT